MPRLLGTKCTLLRLSGPLGFDANFGETALYVLYSKHKKFCRMYTGVNIDPSSDENRLG